MMIEKNKLRLISLLGMIGISGPALAELNDSPYFNLFPGATEVRLCGTSACDGGSNSDINYATFSTVPKNSATGSGVIDPFLRFQHQEGAPLGSADVEYAFNTTNTNVGTILNPDGSLLHENQAKDSVAGGQKRMTFNHAVSLSSLLMSDGDLATFLLDINETGGGTGSRLRIDELALWIADTDMLNEWQLDAPNTGNPNNPTDVATGQFTGNVDGAASGAKMAQVWDMDYNELTSGGAGWNADMTGVDYDADPTDNFGGIVLENTDNIASGSGDWDMEMTLAKDLFVQVANQNGIDINSAYVYLYNMMGEEDPTATGSGDESACCGFEEWGALVADTTGGDGPGGGNIPEPSTAFLLLGGLAGVTRLRRSRAL